MLQRVQQERPGRSTQVDDEPVRWTDVLRRLGAMLICAAIGIALGIGSARWAERHATAIGAVRIGAWTYAPDAGTPRQNPYIRARFARSGAVPIPSSIGVAVTATEDSEGRPLDLACRYQIEGPMPRVRTWTLEAANRDGAPIANAADRRAFTSADVIWQTGAALAIAVASGPQPGNWLPISGIGPFTLVLRLYEPAFSTTSADTAKALTLPAVTRLACG